MNQNNSTWSGLQKKRIENTKTTLKEHEKEQRKKWNNKATQRMNIQEKYTICFESGIDNTVYRHLKMEHYSTFDKNIPATCHSAALLWYIQYNQRYTCTCILKKCNILNILKLGTHLISLYLFFIYLFNLKIL